MKDWSRVKLGIIWQCQGQTDFAGMHVGLNCLKIGTQIVNTIILMMNKEYGQLDNVIQIILCNLNM